MTEADTVKDDENMTDQDMMNVVYDEDVYKESAV